MKIKFLLFLSLMLPAICGLAQITATKVSDTVNSAGTAKVFGGTSQYNTFSIGVNVGATAPSVFTGGVNAFPHNKPELGYGISLRDQLAHSFALQLDFHGGKLAGDANGGAVTSLNSKPASSFETKFLSGTLSGVVNFGNINFLQRKNVVNFYASVGAGLAMYAPKVTNADGTVVDWDGLAGPNHNSSYVKELLLPVGVGVRFRLSDNLDLNLGYTENFIDGFNLTGVKVGYPAENKYSYGYAGLEYTFGRKSKPSLEWVNPVAMMYDELYDAALRQEVEALKGRVGNVETSINDLKKDSDGDGVADQFDKCPNTPAGTVVDGSGCPIVFPKDTIVPEPVRLTAIYEEDAYPNILFSTNSPFMESRSFQAADKTFEVLHSNPGKKITLYGFAAKNEKNVKALSLQRANAVKTYLVNRGINGNRISVKGFGDTHPIGDNDSIVGRTINRRVECH